MPGSFNNPTDRAKYFEEAINKGERKCQDAEKVVEHLLEDEGDVNPSSTEILKLMMGHSKEYPLTELYLMGNAKRGEGRGHTPLTFLRGRFKGKPEMHLGEHVKQLRASLKRRVELGLASEGVSEWGKPAYYPKTDTARFVLGRQ